MQNLLSGAQAKDVIEKSGRFDAGFYHRSYRDLLSDGQSPLDHFLTVGHDQGLLPSAHFDPIAYKLMHPDRKHSNALVDCILNGDRRSYRNIGVLFADIDVRAIPLTIRYKTGLRADWTANAQKVIENIDHVVQIESGGTSYKLRNPHPEVVFSRLRENRPFAFSRITHGVWDSWSCARLLVAQLRHDKRAATLKRQEIENLAIRLLAREYLDQSNNGCFLENIFTELTADILGRPADDDFWLAIALKAVPTYDEALAGFFEQDVDDRRALLAEFFRPSDTLYDATLWKRWSLSGDLGRLAELCGDHPVVLVGPAKFHSLGRKWGIESFRHVSIANRLSEVVRHSLLDDVATAIEAAVAEGKGVCPVVLFQSGQLAFWCIRRLWPRHPNAFYLDLGQALDIWYWDTMAPWMDFYGDALRAANTTAVEQVSNKEPAAPSSAVAQQADEILRLDYLDPALMTMPPCRAIYLLTGEFAREGKYGWAVALPSELQSFTDNDESPHRSPLVLLENGVALGPGHDLHAAIFDRGGGLYSFWKGGIYFSTSDNSLPLTNGRTYAVGLLEFALTQGDLPDALMEFIRCS